MTLRVVQADNPGPFTLDGTRTWVVGRSRAAVIDPGPDDPGHLDAVAALVATAHSVALLVTHGHDDHAGGAAALARRLGAPVLGAWDEPPVGLDFRPLRDGEPVLTDAGGLLTIRTPGHAREHVAYHWPARRALFAGDLILGQGDTTWVGAYPGCVADYLRSLERVGSLGLEVIHPAHGPDLPDPPSAIERFWTHRRARVRQVAEALEEDPTLEPPDIVRRVYDAVPPGLEEAALRSVEMLVHHVRERGPG